MSFTDEDMRKIFDPTTYSRFATEPNYRYIPFIMAFSGLRAEEAASLLTANIATDGMPFFRIDGKRKVPNRDVPIHSKIIESSFMEYLDERREKAISPFLFPELAQQRNGMSRPVSRRFKRYLEDIGLSKDENIDSIRQAALEKLKEKGEIISYQFDIEI